MKTKYVLMNMIKWYCNKCGKRLRKPYRINVFHRDPTRKYVGSGLPIVHTINEQYCKTHFKEVLNKIEKIL